MRALTCFTVGMASVDGLCLKSPFASLVKNMAVSVHVEASQVDFSGESSHKPVSCGSISGPHCAFDPESKAFRSDESIESDSFSRVLGIPNHLAVFVNGSGATTTLNTILQNMFKTGILRYKGHRFFGDLLILASESHYRIGKERIKWTGDFYVNPSSFMPLLIPSSSFVSSILFSRPIVVQELEIIVSEEIMLVGYRLGKEQWRRFLSPTRNSLIGAQVFAVWKGNGALHRGTIMYEERNSDVYYINWASGDQSFRQVAREEIASVIQGRPESLYSVDKIEFYADPSVDSRFEITRLIASFGSSGSNTIKVVRSGGGLVFDDDVSPGAVLYSANDLIELGLNIVKDEGWSSDELVRGLAGKPNQSPDLTLKKTFRNLVLWAKGWKDEDLIRVLKLNMNPEMISKYLNLNEMFNGLVDSGKIPGSATSMFKLFSSIKQRSSHILIGPGDVFHGEIVCTQHLVSFDLEIEHIDMKHLIVVVKTPDARAIRIVAEKGPLGSIYIPSKDGWMFPLLLVPVRQDSLTILELIGTVEYIGCGGLEMMPKHLSKNTSDFARNLPLETWQMGIRLIIHTFNSFIMKTKLHAPSKSDGVGNLIGLPTSSVDELDELDD